MSRRLGLWLAGAGVAIVVQVAGLLVAGVLVAGGADDLVIWLAGSVAGVLFVGLVFAFAGLPPAPRLRFVTGGIAANLFWFIAAFDAWGGAVIGVVSSAVVIGLSSRIDRRAASA